MPSSSGDSPAGDKAPAISAEELLRRALRAKPEAPEGDKKFEPGEGVEMPGDQDASVAE